MNSEIEQRIVAMYFDNKDFEKNAKQTINTLGELKDSLNLEQSVKGFDELDRAGKKLNLNQARTTIKNMKDSLSGMEGALKKAFDIGTAPVHALENFFGTFRSYVGKFLGFDLASKFVGSLESAMRQLTTAPIEAGWSMYQANVDSTKTIMSGTLKSYKEQMSKTSADWTYDEQEHMEYVKGQLAELSAYAQKTVFSLSDMTANVGKFTNNNIDLETSVTAMEGIANMTAKAGQGAQQASMAMYNFSQALGVGKMTTIDWKSIENANLATTELKQLFIDTATAAGKLTRTVSKDSAGKEFEKFFITVDKNGKKLAKNKWIEVSAENFRDSLSNGWLDKDTMLRVFQIYSNQVNDLDTLAAWGFDTSDKELMEYLMGIGESAEAAATQVRTFGKMWDAMTESVQSGWADSMQFIFGDMLEATEFWSTINDKIGAVLDASAEKRNNILREWRGLSYNNDTGEWEKLEGAVDGRQDLIQAIYGTVDALKSIGSAFRQAWSDVFGEMTGEKLQSLTKGFRDFIDRFKEWLGDMKDSNSRLSKIRNAVGGVLSVLKFVGSVIKTIFGVATKLVTPVIDPLLNLFSKFGKVFKLDGAKNLGEMLATLRTRFTELWDKLKGLGLSGIFKTIGDRLSNLWTEIRDGIGKFLEDNGLGGVRDWFVKIGDKLKEGYETLKTWWKGSGIPEFFKNIWDSIINIFKPTLEVSYGPKGLESKYTDSPFVSFFKNTWEKLKTVFEEVKGWPIWGTISGFFTGIWDTITSAFKPTLEVYYGPKGLESKYADSPFVAFFKKTWESVKAVFEEVKNWGIWNTIGTFFTGIWNTIADVFRPTLEVSYGPKGLESKYGDSPFVAFFKNTWNSIKAAFEEVKSWGIWNTIGTFFTGVWDTISDLFKPTLEVYYGPKGKESKYGDSPFVAFFKNTWNSIKAAFEEVKSWGIWNTIGTFFTGVWDTISDLFKPTLEITYGPKGLESKYGDPPFVRFFRNAWESLKTAFEEIKSWPVWSAIGSFFSGIWERISGIFQPTLEVYYGPKGLESKYGDSPFAKFFKNTWERIKEVFEEVKGWPIWETVGNFFTELWNKVAGFFSGQQEATEIAAEASKSADKATPVNENSVSLFEQLIGSVTSFVTKIAESLNGVIIPPEITTFFTNALDMLKAIIGFVGEMMGHVTHIINGEGSAAEWGTLIAVIIGILAEKVFTYKNNKLLSGMNTESFASRFMSMGIGLLAISAAISLLTTIDQGKMWSAVGAVTVVGAVLGVIVSQIAKNTKNQTGLAAVTGKTEIWTKAIGAIEKVGMVAVALALLPNVIKAFAEAKKLVPEMTGSEIFEVLGAVATLLVSVSLGLALVTKITGNTGISPLAAIKTAVSVVGVMAVVLAGFTGIIGLIGGITELLSDNGDIDQVIKIINNGAAVIAAVGGAIGGFFSALFGGGTPTQKADEAKRQLQSLGEASEVFDMEKVTGISRMMTLVQSLSKQGQTIDPSKLNGFAEAMGKLGAGIYEYTRFLKGDEYMEALSDLSDPTSDIYTRLMAFQDLGMKLGELFSGWGNDGWSMTTAFSRLRHLADERDPESIQQLVTYLNKIMTGLGDLEEPDTGIQFDGITIVTKLYRAIQDGLLDPKLPSFDATPIVDSILTAIGLGESAIALAVHNMVQAGINGSEKADGKSGYTFNLEDVLGSLSDPESTQNGIDRINGLTNQYQEMFYGKGGTADSPESDSFFGFFSGLAGNMEELEIPDMSEKLKNSFSFTDPETGEPMDLAKDLKDTLATFQEELNKTPAFEITVIPTFDLRNLNTPALRSALKDYPVGMPLDMNVPDSVKVGLSGASVSMDIEGIKARIDNVANAVTEGQRNIVVAVQSVETRLNQVSSAIYNLKLYLDTGALVGGIAPAIDRELGRRAALASVTGVSPALTSNNYYEISRP